MTQTEIVERFFSMERKLRELSGELIAKGMTVEEIKKATEKDIKDFSDFAYNNSDTIYNAIKENLIEQLKNDAIKPIDALFIYLMVTNFTPINSLQSDHLSHSVTKINNQVLANSAKSIKDLQEHIDECWQTWVSSDNNPIANGDLTKEEFEFYAHHFAQWQKEQMKKDAIECTVFLSNGRPVINSGNIDVDAEFGDKVKVIILPSDNNYNKVGDSER